MRSQLDDSLRPRAQAGMKLRIVIADDEPLALDRLRRLLQEEPEVEIVAECASGAEALQATRHLAPDVLMLDVRMPELDAFQVIQAIGETSTAAVILVTAYDEFAVRAFETSTVDYLLKPFDQARLKEALRRARLNINGARQQATLSAVLERLLAREQPVPTPDRIPVKVNGRIVLVKVKDISWARSADNYCELHAGSSVYLVRFSMTNLEERLAAAQFIRISRSLLVNLEAIKEVRVKSHGDLNVTLRDGQELTASRNYREPLLEKLGRLT